MPIPKTMRAMVFQAPRRPLVCMELPIPKPSPDQVLLKVHACGVCRTDLHVVDGELPHPKLPIIPGHEIVGSVIQVGENVSSLALGDRIGVPWLGSTCNECFYCRTDRENLCDHPQFTGYTLDGGYAEYVVADKNYCFPLPASYSNAAAAPLLCAGLIGYRSYRMIDKKAQRLGIYGFGGAAHIIAQIAVYERKQVFAFTRPGDIKAQNFALGLGGVWAGDSDIMPPALLDAALIFAPIGALIPAALRATVKGGIVVCGGIHMSDIPSFPYSILWEERVLRSVANLTRKDGKELLEIAPRIPIKTEVAEFMLTEANEALACLRDGRLQGAAVLVMDSIEEAPSINRS
jgi:alcohol dehydrogenase, propanol-preferring